MKIVKQQVLDALQSYNETEVRFHVLDPILRALGYPGKDDVYLKLEEKLEYPYYHIGHRSKKKDQPLGFPDYRAGLKGGRGSFIIEAKAGNIVISQKDVEQAHSYAAHAQVGANYFVLCGGSRFLVYETLSGSECKPIVEIPISEIDDRFHELENVLSPFSLAKNCQVAYDVKLRLCDGLGSRVKIHSGEYCMDGWSYRFFINGADSTEILRNSLPQIADLDAQLAMMEREFDLRVAEGFAERDAGGSITACVIFAGITKNSRKGMKLLGIDSMAFSTNEKFLSVDENNPTVFESTADFCLVKGTMIPPLFGDAVPIATDMTGDVLTIARMHKCDDTIKGEYIALVEYRFSLVGMESMIMELDLFGRFSLRLTV